MFGEIHHFLKQNYNFTLDQNDVFKGLGIVFTKYKSFWQTHNFWGKTIISR